MCLRHTLFFQVSLYHRLNFCWWTRAASLIFRDQKRGRLLFGRLRSLQESVNRKHQFPRWRTTRLSADADDVDATTRHTTERHVQCRTNSTFIIQCKLHSLGSPIRSLASFLGSWIIQGCATAFKRNAEKFPPAAATRLCSASSSYYIPLRETGAFAVCVLFFFFLLRAITARDETRLYCSRAIRKLSYCTAGYIMYEK